MMSLLRNRRPVGLAAAGYDLRAITPRREVPLPDQFPQTPLRYRWFGGGYRSEDVEVVLAECRLAVRQLERRVAPLRDREGELERELDSLRDELSALRARQTEVAGQVEAALSHSGTVEQLARDQSGWVAEIADREPPMADRVLRLNEELLASAQTLDAQLRHVDETLRGLPASAVEPAPPVEPEAEAPPAEPAPEVAVETVWPEQPGPVRPRPVVRFDEPPASRGPRRAPLFAEVPPRPWNSPPPALGAREELSGLGFAPQRRPSGTDVFPLLVIGIVAFGLAAAVGLAVAGYATAAVILLAAFALGIAVLSVFGIGRPVSRAAAPAQPVRLSLGDARPLAPVHAEGAEPVRDDVAEEAPEPVALFDPAEAQRELSRLARERARRLVELGDAVELGDDDAASEARSRLRELDGLIAAKEAEIQSAAGADDDDDAAVTADRPLATPVANNSQYDDF